jgi:hypothetical protein
MATPGWSAKCRTKQSKCSQTAILVAASPSVKSPPFAPQPGCRRQGCDDPVALSDNENRLPAPRQQHGIDGTLGRLDLGEFAMLHHDAVSVVELLVEVPGRLPDAPAIPTRIEVGINTIAVVVAHAGCLKGKKPGQTGVGGHLTGGGTPSLAARDKIMPWRRDEAALAAGRRLLSIYPEKMRRRACTRSSVGAGSPSELERRMNSTQALSFRVRGLSRRSDECMTGRPRLGKRFCLFGPLICRRPHEWP